MKVYVLYADSYVNETSALVGVYSTPEKRDEARVEFLKNNGVAWSDDEMMEEDVEVDE